MLIFLKEKENCKVCSWDIVETGDPNQIPLLSDAVTGSTIVFFSVPSKFFRESVSTVGYLTSETILVSCTKGFDAPLLKFPFEDLKNSIQKYNRGYFRPDDFGRTRKKSADSGDDCL